MKPILVSAHNPMTGPRHLGHLASTMADWTTLEKKYELFLVIDDLIATLLYPKGRPEIVNRTLNVAREFMASGIDPRTSHVVLTSMVPEIHELTFFTGQYLEIDWLRDLYQESFAGLLDSYQRYELNMPRLASSSEVVYPQLSLASLTLGLKASAFQGGEEMKGYMHIMEAICEKASRSLGFAMPKFLAGASTFLLGTDGKHMAADNAIYISSPENDLRRRIRSAKSAEVYRNWYTAFGRERERMLVKEPLDADSIELMSEFLLKNLKPYREFKVSNRELVESLEKSALITRERLSQSLAIAKRAHCLPGY